MARSTNGYSIGTRSSPPPYDTVAYYNYHVSRQLGRLKWWKQWVWLSAREGNEARFADDLATYAGVRTEYDEALAMLRKAAQSEVEPAAA